MSLSSIDQTRSVPGVSGLEHTINCRVAGFSVRLRVNWAPAMPGVARMFDACETTTEPPHLDVTVERPFDGSDCRRDAHGFRAIYGNFLEANWDFEKGARVSIRPRLFPFRAIRPLVDPEGHAIHVDVGRIIHERVIPSFVQLLHADRMSFIHGAAMADQAGRGLLISGEGGVGKTSLALELGREHGWSFISDDMVIVDQQGMMHLNANHPKLYAYNVVGDPALEEMLLRDDGPLGRLQWRVRKRWPSHVRREIDPATLYTGAVATAPLQWMLIVERADVPEICLKPLDTRETAARSTDILLDELAKVRPAIEDYIASDRAPVAHTWKPDTWTETLSRGIADAQRLLVQVPRSMQAIPYRRAMADVIAGITGRSGHE